MFAAPQRNGRTRATKRSQPRTPIIVRLGVPTIGVLLTEAKANLRRKSSYRIVNDFSGGGRV
jgi:hypothetical protein